MSFANDVKTELQTQLPNARHCQLAELAAIRDFTCGRIAINTPLEKKYLTLQNKTNMLDLYADENIKRSCCMRAYIRGAFLSAGYINNPEKSYNLEFVCTQETQSKRLGEFLGSFGVTPHRTERNGNTILYIKEAEAIVDVLNIMGAHRALMYMETLRVEKDVRNSVNRKVNCETANIAKTVGAAEKQIADIRKIDGRIGLSSLPAPLYEMAMARLEHEESSLTELGSYLNPPVGKSGVNHRLRKLSRIAEEL